MKNSLPHIKCVLRLSVWSMGRFMAVLWVVLQTVLSPLPRLGTPAKRPDRSTEGKRPLQKLQLPPNSAQVTQDSLLSIRDLSSRHICTESELKVANLCKLRVTQTVEDSSSYSRQGWVTKHQPHRQPIDRLAELARFRFASPTRARLCVNYFLVNILFTVNVVYEKAYCPAFLVILAARSEISTWSNVLSLTSTPSVSNLSCLQPFG